METYPVKMFREIKTALKGPESTDSDKDKKNWFIPEIDRRASASESK